MNTIGLKITEKSVSYETYETLGYLLEYEFEYKDMVESVMSDKIIELDIEEAEDIEVLNSLLTELTHTEVGYKLYQFLDEKWLKVEIEDLNLNFEEE
jgi:hypothetical protein